MKESRKLNGSGLSQPVQLRSIGTPLQTPLFDLGRVWKLMDGAIDIHIHSGPDAYTTRIGNDLDLAIQACQVGMGAVVFKCSSAPTARSAQIVQKIVNQWAEEHNKKRTDVFGGVVLNYAVGGLNPEAVLVNARLGGKYVWTPNLNASHHHRMVGKPGGIDVLDENGNMVPILREVFSLIAEADIVLGICHQSVKERFVLIDEAKKMGIKRIELVHPTHPINKMTIKEQKTAAKKGAYVGLYCWGLGDLPFHSAEVPSFDWDETLGVIKQVGPEHLVIATDAGHFTTVTPAEAMRAFIATLLAVGISDKDIERMVKINPRNLLY